MIQKKSLGGKIKKMFTTKGSDATKIEITPYRDWRVVVLVFFIGILTSFGFNAYLFMGVNEDSFFGGTMKKDEVVTFNKEKLLGVLDTFQKKEEKSEALKKVPTPIVDPSL